MHILSIDVGTYSVKYISSFVDKRRVSHVDMSEVIVRDYINDHEGLTDREAQTAIIQEIIDSQARPDTKIVYQSPNEMMTTRYLTLPVKSKKKAEQMLPFQLEEDIPYALSEMHYAYRLEGMKSQHVGMVELANYKTFEDYFNLIRDKNILPHILTTETSAVENYVHQNQMVGPVCILDVGHRTTKAYFFYNSRLLVSHVSYMGGSHINEMIAQTYQIDPEEAIFYKHQNAFLLTSGQYNEADTAQREFAGAMERVFAPLISDFARWRIGFKVNFGLAVSHVYLTGGTANVKNIANYLTEKWDTKVSLLETFDKVEAEKVDLNPKNKSKFCLANMMAQGFKKKNRFINLLVGRFAQASVTEVPLHSFAFIGVRVAAATSVLALSLLVERVFIEKDVQFVNAKLTAIMKNEELQIPGRMRREFAKNPKPVHDMLVKRQRSVRQEISTLQSAVEIQALAPLVTVSQIASSSEATLTHFESNDVGEVKLTFSAEKIEQLNGLKEAFERSSLQGVQAQIDQAKLQLTISAGI